MIDAGLKIPAGRKGHLHMASVWALDLLALPWPLPVDAIQQADAADRQRHAAVLDTAQFEALIAVTGTNAFDNIWFRRGERLIQRSLVPWPPGVDHRPAIDAAARAPREPEE